MTQVLKTEGGVVAPNISGTLGCSAAQSDLPLPQLQGEEQQGDHNAEPAGQGGADVGRYDGDGEDREHVANPAANLGYFQVIQFGFFFVVKNFK